MTKYGLYKSFPDLWLQEIPEDWDAIKIKYLFGERSEKGYPEEPLLVSSQNMGVVPKDVFGNRTVEASKDLHLLKLVQIGDFVISLRSFQGGLEYAYYRGIISPAYTILIPGEKIDGGYFRYLAKSVRFIELLQMCVTGIREGQNIDYMKLKNHLIPVPSTVEQRKIAQYLDWQVSKISKLMAAKKKKLALLREVIDREFRNVTAKKSSLVKLKYLFALENDFFIPEAESMYQKAGMYNRGRGIFLREPCPGEELGDSKFQRIARDRLMLSGQFAWEDAVYITQEKDEQGIASHRYYLLKPTCSVSVEYLFAYFLSSEGFFNLQQCSHGSAGRNRPLNIKEVLNLSIPVPNDENDTERLALIIRNYMALQVDAAKENELLYELKMKLISDVVTGQIDVRGIEIPEYEYIEETDDFSDDESDDDIDVSDEEV